MHPFAWQQARSAREAAALARATTAEAMLDDTPEPDRVVLKAGGIDLLDLLKEELLRPARLVDLRAVPDLDGITESEGALRVGALVTLERLAAHPLLRQRYAALAEAAGQSASPQIRRVATLGGNLLQRPRCWYFRSAAHHCARKGGDHCFAFDGENQYHAVFGHDGCAMVFPSTAATALAAFGAEVEVLNAAGAVRVVPFGDFVVGPELDVTRETVLRAGEVLLALRLPVPAEGTRSAFLKFAEKASFDWSAADVAVVLRIGADGVCRRAAVVLGAVAPVPWRASRAEAALEGRVIDAAAAEQAGAAAIEGARPLSRNGYKLPVIATLVRRGVLRAAGLPQEAALG